MNFRPSNIIRGIENVAIGASRLAVTGASHVAHSAAVKAHNLKRDFRIEYEARRALSLRKDFREQVARVMDMSPAQQAEYMADTMRINERLAELREAERLHALARDAKRQASRFR